MGKINKTPNCCQDKTNSTMAMCREKFQFRNIDSDDVIDGDLQSLDKNHKDMRINGSMMDVVDGGEPKQCPFTVKDIDFLKTTGRSHTALNNVYSNTYIHTKPDRELSTSPEILPKHSFYRTTYYCLSESQESLYVRTFEATKHPGYYLCAENNELTLQKHETGSGSLETPVNSGLYFITHKAGDLEVYESVHNRGLFIAIVEGKLCLQPYNLDSGSRLPDSIVFKTHCLQHLKTPSFTVALVLGDTVSQTDWQLVSIKPISSYQSTTMPIHCYVSLEKHSGRRKSWTILNYDITQIIKLL